MIIVVVSCGGGGGGGVLNIICHFECSKHSISASRCILMWSSQNDTLELLGC